MTTLAHSIPSDTSADVPAARRWLWRSLILLVVGAAIGATWDRIWHATVPFDGFWSPPHVVVYATVTLVALMGMGILFTPRLRNAFGNAFDIRIVPFAVPGGLFLIGCGLGLLGLAGAVLDNIWHSTFGLNETGWSFPHAMLGTALWLVSCGYLSSRLTMDVHKPTPATTKILLGFLVIWLGVGILTGPLTGNRTPESVRFLFTSIPALASQDSAQQVLRIYDDFNLNRTHPLMMVLTSVWLGAALVFMRQLDKRWWILVFAFGLLWLMDAGNRDFGEQIALYIPAYGNEGNWRSLPIFLPALLFVLVARWRLRMALGLAGALFALISWGIWGTPDSWQWLAVLASIPAAILGGRIGAWLYPVLAQPRSFRVVAPLIAAVVLLPAATGVLDLVLRASMG